MASMRMNFFNTEYKTSTRMEKVAQQLLTPYAFKILQAEMVAAMDGYVIYPGELRGANVRHIDYLDAPGRWVEFDIGNQEIRCSCRMFEYTGILCRHALKVLLTTATVIEIPERYLPERWRRIPAPLHRIHQSSDRELREREGVLKEKALRVAIAGACSQERYDVTTSGLDQLLTQVDALAVLEPLPRAHSPPGSAAAAGAAFAPVASASTVANDLMGNPTVAKTKGRPRQKRIKSAIKTGSSSSAPQAAAKRRCTVCRQEGCNKTRHGKENLPGGSADACFDGSTIITKTAAADPAASILQTKAVNRLV